MPYDDLEGLVEVAPDKPSAFHDNRLMKKRVLLHNHPNPAHHVFFLVSFLSLIKSILGGVSLEMM
jgi:hypothetical protein